MPQHNLACLSGPAFSFNVVLSRGLPVFTARVFEERTGVLGLILQDGIRVLFSGRLVDGSQPCVRYEETCPCCQHATTSPES